MSISKLTGLFFGGRTETVEVGPLIFHSLKVIEVRQLLLQAYMTQKKVSESAMRSFKIRKTRQGSSMIP